MSCVNLYFCIFSAENFTASPVKANEQAVEYLGSIGKRSNVCC